MPIPVLARAQPGIFLQSNDDRANRALQHQPAALAAPDSAAHGRSSHRSRPKNTRNGVKLQLPPAPSFRDDAAALSGAYKALGLAWQHNERKVTSPTFRSSLYSAAHTDQFHKVQLSQLSFQFPDYLLCLVAHLRLDTRGAGLHMVTKREAQLAIRRQYEIRVLRHRSMLVHFSDEMCNCP